MKFVFPIQNYAPVDQETIDQVHVRTGKEVRKCEKCSVNYANTGRLKDSAIPYMQRILNNDNLNKKGEESKRKVLHQEENPKRKIRKAG